MNFSNTPRVALALAALALFAAPASAADYRGMPTGWPATSGYVAAYPTGYAARPTYYVARPVAAQAYAPGAPTVAYMPVNAAYSNPGYYAGYYGAPAGRAPAVAYYAPTNAAYAARPVAAYAPAYAAAPVAMYRPVTVYQPTVAVPAPAYAQPATCYQPAAYQPATCYQPTTCYQPAPTGCGQQAATGCGQQSRRHCLSCLNPFTWFGNHRWGRGGGCGSAPPTTAYCASAYQPAGCGQPQPYYPGTQVVPVMPVPATMAPTFTPAPTTVLPPGTRTIPPPPTRIPGGAASPADVPPRITTPGGSFTPLTPLPGTTTPGTTIPGGSFPTTPGTTAPTFGVPSTTFPSGTNYPPATDPYSRSSTTREPAASAPGSMLRTPKLDAAQPSSLQTVPDPDVRQPAQPVNRAPQLLDPRDKAVWRKDQRWSVVPAVWPSQQTSIKPMTERAERTAAPVQPNPADYADGGWRSGR